MNVFEKSTVEKYLRKRNILKQYLKVKQDIKNDNFKAVNLKKRKPYSEEIWYFRINKK